MQRITTFLLSIVLLLSTSIAMAKPETYTFDPKHTSVTWRVSHFDFSYPSGRWFVHGTLIYDQEHPEKSTVDAAIKLATLDTGIFEFNKHLLSSTFFNVKKYPVATFKSTRVVVVDKTHLNVTGELRLHGVTNPITFKTVINQIGEHPYSKQHAIGLSATTVLDRSKFGIRAFLPGVGNEVKIRIEAEAIKKADKQPQK